MKIDIYQYTSAILYFSDSYKHLKLTTDLSLRQWTEGMGFDSPTLVMDLLKKKRPLKLKYADILTKGLGLDFKESTYFKTLIQLEKANEEEATYFQEVLSSLRPLDTFVDKEGGVFSHWLNTVIFTLGQMNKSPMGIDDIQAALKQNVSLRTIEDSLKVLVENKLLRITDNGKYENWSHDFITTKDDVPVISTHMYYAQILSKTQSAIKLNIDEREFQCFAIGMKKENLVKIKEIMRKARKDVAAFSDDHGDHVYQFNFNGFPMAELQKAEN